MRNVARMGALLLAALGFAAPVQAQEHVVTEEELHGAVLERAETAERDRAVLSRLLEREEVREVAGRAGLDLEKAANAVPTLDGEELRRLAETARGLDDQLAGGQNTVTITTTTIIIVLLIIILVIVA